MEKFGADVFDDRYGVPVLTTPWVMRWVTIWGASGGSWACGSGRWTAARASQSVVRFSRNALPASFEL